MVLPVKSGESSTSTAVVVVSMSGPSRRCGIDTLRGGKDSPRSWLVCAACFWVTLCYFAFHRTANIIYPVLARDYDFSRKVAFDMFGTLIVSSCLAGLTVSYLTRWISARILISMAIIMAAVGLALPYLEISPGTILVLGGLYGIGRGTLNNQLTVILSRHFDKHRTKAVGIQRAGICLSGFSFSASVPHLIDELGLPGTFLTLTGVMLNSLIGVIFLTYPEESSVSSISPAAIEPEASALLKDVANADGIGNTQHVHAIMSSDNHHNNNNNNNDSSISNGKSISQLSVHRIHHVDETNKRLSHYSARSRRSSVASSILEAAADPMDILTAESLAGVRAEKDKVSERNETQSGTSDEDPGTGQLFRHIMLYPLYMNTLSLYLQFNVFMVLLDVAQDNGVSAQDAPKLNLIFSVVEVFAYLSVGFVTKERRGRTRNLQIICQLLCGVIPFLYGISSTFTHFAVLTAVSAYTTGTMLLLNVILMRQYLGEALFARALGVTQTTGIISYFAVSPLISYYRDVHKSYAPFLQIISILCIVFSLFWLLEIPYAINERKRSRNDEKVKHSPTATI